MTKSDGQRGTGTRYSRSNPGLGLALRELMPTLTVRGNHNVQGQWEKSGDGLSTRLKKLLPTLVRQDAHGPTSNHADLGRSIRTELLPTLTTRDAHMNGSPSTHRDKQGGKMLNAVLNGPINPPWATWYMGFPESWLDRSTCSPLRATGRCASLDPSPDAPA